MQNLPISAHLTVVSATPASAADSAAQRADAALPGGATDFSSLLASQLVAKGVPGVPTAGVPTAIDGVAPPRAAAPAESPSAADAANSLAVIGFVPFAAPAQALPAETGDEVSDHAGRANGLARVLAISDEHGAERPQQVVAGGEQPAAELPANFAASDPRLPAKTQGHTAVEELAPAIEHAAKLTPPPESGAVESNAIPPGFAAHAVAAPKNEGVGAPAPQPANVSIDTRVGSPSWGSELGQKVVWLANQQQQVAHINVTPPQLGPIEIRLNLAHDQASATFVSPHAAVRDAIEAALPRLRDMLAESGLTLANVDVSAHSFGHARQDHPQQSAPSRSEPSAAMAGTLASSGLALGASPGGHRGGEGLVDIFA